MVYCAQPPLYRIQRKKETIYCYSDAELREKSKRGDEITRFKGLGEMSPAELYATTMNPENRQLIQLTVEDFQATLDLFDTLMGSSSKARREFILSNKLASLDDETFIDDDDEE